MVISFPYVSSDTPKLSKAIWGYPKLAEAIQDWLGLSKAFPTRLARLIPRKILLTHSVALPTPRR